MGFGESLADLYIKRSSVKGQVTKFKNFIDKLSLLASLTAVQKAELALKLSKFETLSCKFDELQSQIEVVNSAKLKDELEERESIESDFISNIVAAQALLEKYNKDDGQSELNCSQNIPHCSHEHSDASFKLPSIQISKFDGSYMRWLEFRDTYKSLIHDNARIGPVNKFHYLLSYLEGEAAHVVSNLEISASTYETAWNLLLKRFDNTRLLINNHLNSLFNIQPISRESDKSLRFLISHVTKQLRTLSSLGQSTDQWDILIIHLMASKLDNLTLTKWEEYRNTLSDNSPTLNEFNKFLSDRADILEALYRNKENSSKSANTQSRSNTHKVDRNHTKSHSCTTNNQPSKSSYNNCSFCQDEHRIYDCPQFKAKDVKERIDIASKLGLCNNCLRSGHGPRECRLGPCRECKKRHNTLLHIPKTTTTEVGNNTVSNILVTYSKLRPNQGLIPTALIYVVNPITKKSEQVRALLDCGSQSSFISESLCTKLSLDCHPINFTNVVGFGNNSSGVISKSCIAVMKSAVTSFQMSTSFYVMPQLTGLLPNSRIEFHKLKIPKDLPLADPYFYEPSEIDILIGSNIFWDILGHEKRTLAPNSPNLLNSKFGWLIAGALPLPKYKKQVARQNQVATHCAFNNNNVCDMHKFWELEEIPRTPRLTPDELACEGHFKNNTHRLPTGRFVVKLPLIDSPNCLGDSYGQAKKRFFQLEKRFRKQPQVKSQYIEFIREYEQLGHLSEIFDYNPEYFCFLPHHPVFKLNSESSKIHVVFDASMKTSSGLSLNDIQMVGPQIQDSLFSILIRARHYRYILTGDLEKMYRQILFHESDRQLQLILWREEERLPLKILQLNTVTYGFASASYLSTKCLWRLGEECGDPTIKSIIQHDFYVDDLITGSNSEAELQQIQRKVAAALQAGCFNLRKFRSNSSVILESSSHSNTSLYLSESTSALGLGWNSRTDKIHFSFDPPSSTTILTKRHILSTSFKIFDPLGLLSPCIIIPKLLLQQLWQEKIEWDEPVPSEIGKSWTKFSNSLCDLSSIKIPRYVLCLSPNIIELHSFSDSSKDAYGACIYIRSIDEEGNINVNLLCSKSKVAPLKATTIPRLELCAALLAAQLCKTVTDSLRFPIERKVHWCDSSVVLAWLRTSSRKLKPFVANRISEICELSDPSNWRYIPTDENPADLISRGVYPNEILDNTFWWSGPKFLRQDDTLWPTLNLGLNIDEADSTLPELKIHTLVTSEPFVQFNKYSSLNKLKRIYAYIQRFVFNIKNKNSKRTGRLTLHELRESFHLLCSYSQRESFPVEYALLSKGKNISSKSSILPLTPLMEHGLIRVGGRLNASSQPHDVKHPILLHSSHHFTKIIFEREHVLNLHAGPQLLLASVRQSIWPINGRNLARRTVRNCVKCRRIQGRTIFPIMGNLPSQRVTADFPFRAVGIDFAGPFYILNRKGRGAKLVKCYMCIFICFRFKCVHLEAVSDLSTDAFILTLRRFICRRGKPTEIYCDNGRNFVGAAKEISDLIRNSQDSVLDFGTVEEIQFNFSPAYAPHFGGIWEAGVKSAKYHIKRVVGNAHLTFEEISTVFAQVEAILNSRPLCPLSSSPDDLLFLTPGHFLLGRPLNALPAPNFEDCNLNPLQRYARIEQMRQHFWRRWQKEYLAELQQRSKWRTTSVNLQIGDLVLLHEENSPTLCWRLARVMNLFPGPDGVTRVAEVKTTTGIFRRSLTRLCPLPATDHLIES